MKAHLHRAERGFTLVELLIAAVISLMVTGAVAALVRPARDIFQVQLEASDIQQRLRGGVDRLSADLARAGAGPYIGPESGPLVFWFAPIVPYRVGQFGADPPGTLAADRVTLWYVPETAAQATLRSPLDAGSLTLDVEPAPTCPIGRPLCGFSAGMTVLVFDRVGRFDTFKLVSVSGGVGTLTVNRANGIPSARFESGARVVQVVQRSYYRKVTAEGFVQLVYADGSSNVDVPLIDHLAELEFADHGDPQPPMVRRSDLAGEGALTSYGPLPPAPGEQPTLFPSGENCVFNRDALTGLPAARLGVVGGDADRRALVPLTAAELSDGDVWCPDAGTSNRFDADLLRVRKIAVRIKIESSIDALRGPAGVLFARGGSARAGRLFLPDKEIRFQITPPNLGAGF